MNKKPIILIGPMATGKSTIASELAKVTNIPRVPMDRLRWYYYYKKGFSLEKEQILDSFSEMLEYWKPFEVDAVEGIIGEFPESIIDFGAGHSYFTDPDQFNYVSELLREIPNVFLILPCEDKKRSLEIFNERLEKRRKEKLDETNITANKNFIEHPSNYRLAKHIIYTEGKSIHQSCLEIRDLLV
ncbi:MAG: AAA family ATPase [Bacteriovoracaceae bacterium]|jgi:shikimate kinase|nr:AAA family ATPase [Bacteriovoracaceae bacterium]